MQHLVGGSTGGQKKSVKVRYFAVFSHPTYTVEEPLSYFPDRFRRGILRSSLPVSNAQGTRIGHVNLAHQGTSPELRKYERIKKRVRS
jgi:hypothetical protein